MKIIFNAYNLRIGGGETIGKGVINALYELELPHDIYIFITKKGAYTNLVSKGRIKIEPIPAFYTRTLLGRALASLFLIYKVLKINPDVIFSMGNYAIPVRKKQLLFLHWPYVVYPESEAWAKLKSGEFYRRKLRALMFKLYLRYASQLTVQSEIMKEQFQACFDFKGEIKIVETTISPVKPGLSVQNKKIQNLREKYPDHKFLLCISKYYDHKNLEILIPVAEKIKTSEKKIKLVLNLDSSQHPKAKKLLSEIKRQNLSDIIVNLGPVSDEELYHVYQSADAFIIPTLIESFGIIYLEAMYSGLPIFTSDLPFARNICGDAAFYFNPLDADSIYSSVITGMENPDKMEKKRQAGLLKAKQFKSWKDITREYIQLLESL